MDHLPEWADFPCPWSLHEEPSIGLDDEESRFTPRPDKGVETRFQNAGYYFKESFWSWNHHTNYESLDNYSAGNSFGDLPHVDVSTRKYYLRYNRGNKGPDHPNIRRTNEPIHEKSKFNILRNPTDSRKRMDHWDPEDPRETATELEKAAEKIHWHPEEANRPMNAPLQLCPGHKFKTPENKQENCSFVKFMAISEMRTAVIDSLLYEDITSLSRTSQANLRFMEASFTHWDMTHRFFGNANFSADDITALEKVGGEKAEKAQAILKVGTAPLSRVIVSPVRGGRERSYRHKANALEQLFRCIVLHGQHIQYLQLHRIEFLNVESVDHMLDCMASLRRLSILQCPLINFGHTRKLVDMTARINQARVPGKELDLDFYPKAYLGPVHGRHGSYHVMFQDDGFLDTTIAVVACLTTLIPYARKHGVELAMPGRAFRLWLDGFPFKYGTLEKILESIDSLEYHTPEEEQRIIDQAYEEGNIRDEAHEIALRRRMQDALHYDLYIATKGEPQNKEAMECLEYNRCIQCGKGLLAPYFRSCSVHAHDRICHGCDLVGVLSCSLPKLPSEHNNFLDRRNQLAMTLWKRKAGCLQDLMMGATEVATVATRTWDRVLKGAMTLDRFVAGTEVPVASPSCTLFGIQQRPPHDRPVAACWDRERRKFNVLLQTERGVLVNRGPHMGINAQGWV